MRRWGLYRPEAPWSVLLWVMALGIMSGFLHPAKASLPVDVDTVFGFYQDGRIHILAPERYVTGKPMIVSPCSNVPFDAEVLEGMVIRAKGGVDLYNDWFVCPTDVVALGAVVGVLGAEEKAGEGAPRLQGGPGGLQSVLSQRLSAWAVFLQGLERAVNAHDWDSLIRDYIDTDYIREQHDKTLQGNTPQFISELLFPGLHDSLWTTRHCQEQLDATHQDYEQMLRMIHDFSLVQADYSVVAYRFNWGEDCEIRSWMAIILSDEFRLIGPLG